MMRAIIGAVRQNVTGRTVRITVLVRTSLMVWKSIGTLSRNNNNNKIDNNKIDSSTETTNNKCFLLRRGRCHHHHDHHTIVLK
jgi:hypothetical protein